MRADSRAIVGWRLLLCAFQKNRMNMPFEVIDGHRGFSSAAASVFPYVIPTSKAPVKPGPWVTRSHRHPLIPSSPVPAPRAPPERFCRRCSREANSGTTPPYLRCTSICDATTLDKYFAPIGNNGCRSLVARRFDPQNPHAHNFILR